MGTSWPRCAIDCLRASNELSSSSRNLSGSGHGSISEGSISTTRAPDAILSRSSSFSFSTSENESFNERTVPDDTRGKALEALSADHGFDCGAVKRLLMVAVRLFIDPTPSLEVARLRH